MIVGAHTEDEVQLALDWAADSIESYCERKFTYVQNDTVYVNPYRGNGGRAMAMLPNPPIQNVYTVLGDFASNGGLNWQELQFYGWAADGLLYDTSKYYGYFGTTGSSFWSGVANADGFYDFGDVPSWPSLPRSLQVTYAHGFATPQTGSIANVPNLPTGIVNAVIKGASFFLDNASGATDVRVAEIGTKYFDPNGHPAGWLDEKLLGEFRLVHL